MLPYLPTQLLSLVVRPTLNSLSLGGKVPEMVVLGTAAVESGFSALAQVGGGPALSMWQIEPATARDTWRRSKPEHKKGVLYLASLDGPFGTATDDDEAIEVILAQLPGNLYLGAAMCRLVYYLKPFTMPNRIEPVSESSMQVLARIWKNHYNTKKGAGTVEGFMQAWGGYNLGNLWD